MAAPTFSWRALTIAFPNAGAPIISAASPPKPFLRHSVMRSCRLVWRGAKAAKAVAEAGQPETAGLKFRPVFDLR